MGIEDNKRVVAEYMSLFGRSAIPELLAMMRDDAKWTIVGKPRLFAGAGTKTKTEMADIWAGLYRLLEGDLEMAFVGMVAEGDKVAAEVRSRATTRTGKVYDNEYHFLITVRGGLIAEVREYTDLMHAAEIFG